MKLPLLSAKELIAILKKMDFSPVRQEGSHIFPRHPDGRATVVPMHTGRDISRGLLRRILHEIQITREDFMKKIR